MPRPSKLKYRALLVAGLAGLGACSAIGPFTEREKELMNRPMPADVNHAKLECTTLRAHYDWSLFMIGQGDEKGWANESERDLLETDAWADYHRARRIGCTGWD